MSTFYFALFSTTSRNGVAGLRPRVMLTCEADIFQAADREAFAKGASLEEAAGIKWIEDENGMFQPDRELTREERLAVSVDKLGDDGRLFEIFKTDAEGAAAFIEAAEHYGIGDKARSLVDEVG
jgi:hypothetical protein